MPRAANPDNPSTSAFDGRIDGYNENQGRKLAFARPLAEAVSASAELPPVSRHNTDALLSRQSAARHHAAKITPYHPISTKLMGGLMGRRLAEQLGALEVSRLLKAKGPGLHFVGTVAGLALQVTASGTQSWVLRAMVGGRRRDMGLGPYPEVSLAKAHEKAREARELIRQGVDPVDRQRIARGALRASLARALTFRQVAAAYIESNEVAWKNAKHAQQWRNTLETYAYPVIGDLLVSDIERAHVLSVLKPIWNLKTETAVRLRGRIELVLSYAIQAGYRPEGLNPARWRGGLDVLLPRPSKVGKREHFAALPVDHVAGFMENLRLMEGVGARALEFAILTAARSGEVRGATWAEIDQTARVWTIPASRIKGGREHRVPLSSQALALICAMPERADSEYVFAAARGGPLSDMSLLAVLRRMKVSAVPHGFRSTFRDWAAERTTYPNEVCEMALAHTVASKVEAAYRRGDLFSKRIALMADWADFLYQSSNADGVSRLRSYAK